MADHVTYYGHIVPWDGYGLSSCIFLDLFRDRVTLSFQARNTRLLSAFVRFPSIIDCCTRVVPDTKWHIDHTPPVLFGNAGEAPFRNAKCKVLATMWELHKLPTYWKSILAQYDKIIVPDPAQLPIFVRSGVDPRMITVIPEFVDIDWWSAGRTYQKKDDIFRFIVWGQLAERKCPQVTIDAFKKAFPDEQDVRLTLKTLNGFFPAVIDDPRITLIDELYEDVELRALVASHDCVVSVTHGEGYGCCPIQGMALAKPVILNGAFAQATRWDVRYNYPVEDDGLEPCPVTKSYPEPDGGLWVTPSVKRLSERMREVYENQNDAKRKGEIAATEIKNKYDISVIAGMWQHFLDGLD